MGNSRIPEYVYPIILCLKDVSFFLCLFSAYGWTRGSNEAFLFVLLPVFLLYVDLLQHKICFVFRKWVLNG